MFLPTARFTEVNHQQSMIADASGIISCSAEGTPTPQIVWKKKDEGQLDKDRFITFSNGSLLVKQVRQQDKGRYICTLEQTKGDRVTMDERTINVSIISE